MELSLKDLATLVSGKVETSKDLPITSVSSLDKAQSGSISFLANPKYEGLIYKSKASAVLVHSTFEPKKNVLPVLIRVDDPYSSFAVVLEEFSKAKSLIKTGIDSMSKIGDGVIYGEGLFLDVFSVIGDHSTLGDQVKIHANVNIGEGCTIGKNTVIFPGVTIYPHTQIGDYCVIHSGAVIGSDGFGFAPQPDGSYRTIPQVGNVIIEDHVSIGANTVIDCATFDATIIQKGVKLDNLIQVAHNVEIGADTVIAAQVGISGSTKIGKNCMIGGQAGINGHLNIAEKSRIAGQSGVSKSILKPHAVYGNPAFEINDYYKSYSVFKKLPDLLERIEQLEEKILT